MGFRVETGHDCRRADWRRPCANILIAVALVSFCAASAPPVVAIGQVAMAVEADDSLQAAKGFSFSKVDSKTIDSLADFRRYSDKKAWELAFRTLNSLEEEKNKGLAPAGDGFFVPLEVRVQQCLKTLPTEGRDAYRLFNDAAAKQVWDQVRDAKGAPTADELTLLRKIVDQYFLTSVGDLAADRLADSLFEQGHFAEAERLWRQIADDYPDTRLAPAKLQVKRCVALAQLGRREALAALALQVKDKYGDERIAFGGKERGVGQFVQSLLDASQPATHDSHGSATATENFSLPTSVEPAWQIRLPPVEVEGLTDPRTGWPMDATSLAPAPMAVADDQRLYANWFGNVYAADLKTGKLLWRTGKLSGTEESIRELVQQRVGRDSFFVVHVGKRLLCGRYGSANLLGQLFGATSVNERQLRLECLEAESGKTQWSATVGQMLLGQPYVQGDVTYLCNLSGNNSLSLASLSTETGKTIWELPLGEPQAVRNWNGFVDAMCPRLLAIGDTMYVATDNGALLAVDLPTHKVSWAMEHDSKPVEGDQRVFWGVPSPTNPPLGALFGGDGGFYLKDGFAHTMYAVDPIGPALRWKRPITAADSVVAIVGERAYLMGSTLSVLDLKSRKLLWSVRIPGDPAPICPLILPEHILMPTQRGIFDIDPASGDIRRVLRGADRKSPLRQVLLAGDKIIAISSAAITAYPLEHGK